MEVTKSKEPTQEAKEEQKPEIDPAIIDELMKGYQRPEDMTGPGGILEQLTKRVYERILGAEMTHYLGYEKGQAPQREEDKRPKNHRNGISKKTLLSEDGKLEIEVPRDRAGEFEPQFIRKGQRRFGGFDQKIIAMYAQGMTVRSDPTLLGGAIQGRSLGRSNQLGNRLGLGGCSRMAKPAAGADVSGGFL
jgi:putative transposase